MAELPRQSSASDQQREAVEREAAAQGIDPYDLLLKWAEEHGTRAAGLEAGARDARRSQDRCLTDARQWFGRLPVEDVEIGSTVWVYLISSNDGWEYVPCIVLGHGVTKSEGYGDVPNLRLATGHREFDWTPNPDLLVFVRKPVYA